jgi:hypothetical protein
MDRQYKKLDRVVVFETTRKPQSIQTPVDTFSDRPYVHAGFDVYLYKGVAYGAYVCADDRGDSAIFLDSPLPIPGQMRSQS